MIIIFVEFIDQLIDYPINCASLSNSSIVYCLSYFLICLQGWRHRYKQIFTLEPISDHRLKNSVQPGIKLVPFGGRLKAMNERLGSAFHMLLPKILWTLTNITPTIARLWDIFTFSHSKIWLRLKLIFFQMNLIRAPSEDSDQPVNSRSLIRIFIGCILESQGRKVSSHYENTPI